MSDGIRLTIFESNAEQCVAKGLHRSGARLRPISFNDILYGSDNDTPCGIVLSVETERIDRENWLYRVRYLPQHGTLHPVDSFVIWRLPDAHVVPQAVAQRMQAAPQKNTCIVLDNKAPAPSKPGRKQNKKQSVNGQHGAVAQASAAVATATV